MAEIFKRREVSGKVKEEIRHLVDKRARDKVERRAKKLHKLGQSDIKQVDGEWVTTPPKIAYKNIKIEERPDCFILKYKIFNGYEMDVHGNKISLLESHAEVFRKTEPNILVRKYLEYKAKLKEKVDNLFFVDVR